MFHLFKSNKSGFYNNFLELILNLNILNNLFNFYFLTFSKEIIHSAIFYYFIERCLFCSRFKGNSIFIKFHYLLLNILFMQNTIKLVPVSASICRENFSANISSDTSTMPLLSRGQMMSLNNLQQNPNSIQTPMISRVFPILSTLMNSTTSPIWSTTVTFRSLPQPARTQISQSSFDNIIKIIR